MCILCEKRDVREDWLPIFHRVGPSDPCALLQWTAPLAAGLDDLGGDYGNGGGNHANTHIPEIIGSARGYEVSANVTQKAIAETFFRALLANHSWASGGSNDGEHWTQPDRMGDQLNADTEESCTQYNVLSTLPSSHCSIAPRSRLPLLISTDHGQ
jgi:hypothetical protein